MTTPRKPLCLKTLTILATIVFLAGCSGEVTDPQPASPPGPGSAALAGGPGRGCHATGEVELVWKGSAHAPNGAHGDSIRVAAAVFDLHEPDRGQPARGTFRYQVRSNDGTIHREVTANAEGVAIDPANHRVWFIGRVAADTKGCSGAPGGGHDGGCSGDTGGGCSDGHDDGHDGGCSGDHDEGGCTDGGHDDGGCPDGTHDDGGCPDGSHDTGGSGGPAGATGRTCRVGQMIVGKAHDAGSPGVPDDGITWKWFLADDPDLPGIGDLAAWPHLCRKTITGGNLVIHEPGNPVRWSRETVR